MKLKKETVAKSGVKKATSAGIESPVPSVLQIALAKPHALAAQAFAESPSRQTKPIKVTPASAKSKPQRVTLVKAKIDVGFGNRLYIRGQGDGLSWDKGLPLQCQDATTWVWSTKKANHKIEFKLLLNDQIWAQGENLGLAPGEMIETIPAFE